MPENFEQSKILNLGQKTNSAENIDSVGKDIELTPEQQVVKDNMIESFELALFHSDFHFQYFLRILKEKNELPKGVIMSPEIQKAAEKLIRGFLRCRYYDVYNLQEKAVEIKEEFSISEDKINQIVKDEVVNFLRDVQPHFASRIVDTFGNKDEIVLYPEVQQAAMETCIALLSQEKTLVGYAGKTLVSEIAQIRETFNVSSETFQDILVESLDRLTAKQNIVRISEIEKNFGFIILEKEWEESVKKKMIEKIPQDMTLFREMRRMMVFPEKIMLSGDIREAGKQAVFNKLFSGNIEYVAEVLRFFIQRDDISENSFGVSGIAKLFKEEFNVSDEEIQEKVKTTIEEALSSNNLDSIIRIQKLGLTSPELFNSREEIVNLMDIQLRNGNIREILDEVELFNPPDHIVETIDNLSAQKKIPEGNIIRFIQYLGDDGIENKFPKTFGQVKELIFNDLEKNEDTADYFVENLHKYYKKPWVAENIINALKHYSVAKKFYAIYDFGKDKDDCPWKNEVWFSDALNEANKVLGEHIENQDDWQDDEYERGLENEGFKEEDPYEKHEWLFGHNQVLMSKSIEKIIAGEDIKKITAGKEVKSLGREQTVQMSHAKSKQEQSEWEYEIDQSGLQSEKFATNEVKVDISEELQKQLQEIGEKIEISYQKFLEQVRSNPKIDSEDKEGLLNPESIGVKMTPLIKNIRAFIARLIVQLSNGKISEIEGMVNLLTDGDAESDKIYLQSDLEEGFNRYIKTLEIDIPLYDKLYEEFDNYRETGRNPLEVYLGRDGIYAWIGRRTQDIARRKKIGLEGRKKMRNKGEIVEIHPKYLVYPRYFRDNINYQSKRKFLEQERISPEADPLFYDTGYTGTIPEQIMRVMDFDDQEIDQRIRLLSAQSANRRVKGIPENARHDIIEYIEHNAKSEETAEGLIIDKKTGKIRHIAQPTEPKEQFYFMMIKQAIERHYWLKEQLHHEPTGNINLDSEHYTIRIREEYEKLLPKEFLRNPKEFFEKQGQLLKGSKGKGEYPDEEVVLFRLSDETEIIAKRIELRKSKEARKEFSILIAAKKAGLPTAEPVGFLSGKESQDGNYLLMGKLEGHSGRKFEKELKESGEYSDEQIKGIMQQVAEKNKEIAQLFRTTLKIDKRWQIKDTIIEFNKETGEVESVTPIDWERVQNYDEDNPKEIDEIQ